MASALVLRLAVLLNGRANFDFINAPLTSSSNMLTYVIQDEAMLIRILGNRHGKYQKEVHFIIL